MSQGSQAGPYTVNHGSAPAVCVGPSPIGKDHTTSSIPPTSYVYRIVHPTVKSKDMYENLKTKQCLQLYYFAVFV